MKESYSKGLVNRTGPETWRYVRKGMVQALRGEDAGCVMEPRKSGNVWRADLVEMWEGNTGRVVMTKSRLASARSESGACVEAYCAGIGRAQSWQRRWQLCPRRESKGYKTLESIQRGIGRRLQCRRIP